MGGKTVTVDRSDAQSHNQVDCGDTSAGAVTDTSGTASFTSRANSGARMGVRQARPRATATAWR